MRPHVGRLRPARGEAGVIGERLLDFRARVALCSRAGGEKRGGCKGDREERGAVHEGQPRSVAPVFFATSATIFAIAASISASLSVRSRGWSVTLMATDFEPSGRPVPW